jgi:L-lactate dehydrogenase complex protein LldE
VTVHDGCHALRELGLKRPMRELLGQVRDLELVEMTEAETCCGFGGTFAAKFSSISCAMGAQKLGSARETNAEYVVSCDPSCLLHLKSLLSRGSPPLGTLHLAEVLASR